MKQATPGWAGIFHLPYRIHAQDNLSSLEGVNGPYRFRVSQPFRLRKQSSPVTDDVPPELWPNFTWHPNVPEAARLRVIAPIMFDYQNEVGPAIVYDGFRVDIWGLEAADRISPFALSFMRWLRHLSGQPWISDIDRHSPSILKRLFGIDAEGAAITDVHPFGTLRGSSFRFVTNAIWAQAFELAITAREVPVYSNLFFDAVNAAATSDYGRAIMNLAMALEACRDQNFSRFHPAEDEEERGPQLSPPFDGTDLLKHLSKHSAAVFGRDFSAEHPEEWKVLRKLYVARHHVAHGKRPVIPGEDGLKSVDLTEFGAMQMATGVALQWIEALRPHATVTAGDNTWKSTAIIKVALRT